MQNSRGCWYILCAVYSHASMVVREADQCIHTVHSAINSLLLWIGCVVRTAGVEEAVKSTTRNAGWSFE